MHILITGGSGFIGVALVPQLLALGHTVTVLSRSPEKVRDKLPPACRVIASLAEAGSADAVVNLAGETLAGGRWTDARKAVLRSSRIDSTRMLVDWMRDLPSPPKALVSGSAIGYYGTAGDRKFVETDPAGKIFTAQLCVDWEHEALQAQNFGVRVCCVRTGIVLGPRGGALEKMLPPFRLGLGGPTGSGEQWMSWVHRADLCALIVWLLQNSEATGAWNGSAPQPVTNAEFTSTLARLLHRPAFMRIPAFPLKLALGEMSELLLLGQRVIPARAEEAGFRFRFPGIPSALADVLEAEAG